MDIQSDGYDNTESTIFIQNPNQTNVDLDAFQIPMEDYEDDDQPNIPLRVS